MATAWLVDQGLHRLQFMQLDAEELMAMVKEVHTMMSQWIWQGTDLGSLDEVAQEPPADFSGLNATGVEHYRTFPVTRFVWNVINGLLNLQKSIQLGGPKMRRRALR